MTNRRLPYYYRPIRPRATSSVPPLTRETAPDRLLWLDGKTGVTARGAADFDGATQQLSAPSNAAVQIGDVDCWWALWVRLDAKSVERALLTKWSGAPNREYQIAYNPIADRLRLAVTSDGVSSAVEVRADAFGSPPTGVWMFLMAYHDATADRIGISVNGGAFDTTAFSGGIWIGAAPLTLGAFGSGAGRLDGQLDQVCLGKAPTGGIGSAAATIRDALYNGGAGLPYSGISAAQRAAWGMVAGWTLDEPSGNRRDSIGSTTLVDTASTPGVDGIVGSPANEADPVRAWTDRVAGRIFSENAVASRPIYRSASFLNLDGANDRLSLSPGPVVGNRPAFTIVAKVRLDALPSGSPAVIYTEADASGGVVNRLAVSPSGNVVASYRASGEPLVSASSAASLATGVDAVVAVRRDGTALQVFVNGLPSGPAATIGAGTSLAGATARVGGPVESAGFVPLGGRIYDLFAVGRALTDAEVAQLSS
ncbi:LamG-like jellyroll fold domain-containing protein [Tautonia sociabilis]|uniref:LamG-like jellyroll fold domain-containing protein n=1 Tax=Tautonia sociabilis TaxID=2080755 RepID=UPI0013154FFB|nr:LamG-like jellyroll fold domain-containing protein [Tautonia sociabilis]